MTIQTLIAFGVGVIIPLFAIYLLYSFDLFGTGNSTALLACLVWGGVSVWLAMQVNNAVIRATYYEITATLYGPIIEEALKSVMLFALITSPRFRYIVDGAIYGFASGIGFAIVENILYISNNPGAALAISVSRALSTSLMHATTSSLIGIALGHLRRSGNRTKILWALGGFVPAMATHIIYNNIVSRLDGTALLLVAIGIGVIGAFLIQRQIRLGVTDEKERFSQTLGIGVGVTGAERRAVQNLGENAIEKILNELADYFGRDKAEQIRRLLVLQGNIGILQNNLQTQASERLRKAWDAEIAQKRLEMDILRNSLGVYVMSFVRGVFPEEDTTMNDALNKEYTKFDATQVHSFDMFINAGRVSGTLDNSKLAQTADLLSQVEIFKDVPVAELENLSRAIATRSFAPGQLLFEQGDNGDTMYIVEEGEIGIYITDGEQEKQISTCAPGDLVGELALLDGSPRSARARADTPLRVLILRRDHFMMFVRSRPKVLLALLEYLARRARRLSDMVEKSIEVASKIAQGDYQGAADTTLQPASAIGSIPRAALHATDTYREAGKTGVLPDEKPATMSGLFALAKGVLDEREEAAAAKPKRASVRMTLAEVQSAIKDRPSGLFGRIKLPDEPPKKEDNAP